MKEEKIGLIIEMAKHIRSISEMRVATKCATSDIYKVIKENKIYTITQVISLLDKKTNEEIAEEGNVYAEAVARVRRDFKLGRIQLHVKRMEGKKERKVEIDREKLINNQRKEVELLLRFGDSIKSIEKRTGLTRQEIEHIQEKMKTNQLQRTPQNEAKFKTKLVELRARIQHIEKEEQRDTTIINFQIEKMLETYGNFLAEEHYALFAYGYAKLGENDKSIEFGTKYLGLENQSLDALNKKIYEILEREETETKQNKEIQIDEEGGR